MTFDSSMKYKWDNENVLEYALKQAREVERERAVRETKIENAKKMKEAGIETSLISNITGLSKEEIEEL